MLGAAAGVCATFSAMLPLRIGLIILGCLLIIAGIVDYALSFDDALDLIVNAYLVLFGTMALFVECHRMFWNKFVQEGILYWSYFLSRLWGRALLYFFLAILCCSDSGSWVKIVTGIYCFFCVFVMYFVGVQAAKKLKRINVYLSKGTEGEQRIELLKQTYHKLDSANLGSISAPAIVQIAGEAGRELSGSEKEAIVRFFNPNFENEITIDEWITGFEVVREGIRSL